MSASHPGAGTVAGFALPSTFVTPGTSVSCASLTSTVTTSLASPVTNWVFWKVREIVIAKELGENVRTRCSLGLAMPTSNQGTLQADLEWKPFVSAMGVIHRPTSADNNVWSVGAVFVNITSCEETLDDLGSPL